MDSGRKTRLHHATLFDAACQPVGRDQPRVEASLAVNVLNGVIDSTVNVQAKLEAESDIRLRETYESVSVLGDLTEASSSGW